jgi:hypothetical protein
MENDWSFTWSLAARAFLLLSSTNIHTHVLVSEGCITRSSDDIIVNPNYASPQIDNDRQRWSAKEKSNLSFHITEKDFAWSPPFQLHSSCHRVEIAFSDMAHAAIEKVKLRRTLMEKKKSSDDILVRHPIEPLRKIFIEDTVGQRHCEPMRNRSTAHQARCNECQCLRMYVPMCKWCLALYSSSLRVSSSSSIRRDECIAFIKKLYPVDRNMWASVIISRFFDICISHHSSFDASKFI